MKLKVSSMKKTIGDAQRLLIIYLYTSGDKIEETMILWGLIDGLLKNKNTAVIYHLFVSLEAIFLNT
jgi:hypothetical protein